MARSRSSRAPDLIVGARKVGGRAPLEPRWLQYRAITFGHWMMVTSFERVRRRGHPDIRPAHGGVLAHLERSGGRITEIARLEGVSKNAIGQLATELERLGYIARVPDPTDGRAKILRYTERGLDLLRDSQAIGKEIDAELAALVGADKLALLRDLLDEIETKRGAVHPDAQQEPRRIR